MQIETKKIPVTNNTASIDTTDSKHIYLVSENGDVTAIPLPQYGTLEIACQNHHIGNIAVRATIKI